MSEARGQQLNIIEFMLIFEKKFHFKKCLGKNQHFDHIKIQEIQEIWKIA